MGEEEEEEGGRRGKDKGEEKRLMHACLCGNLALLLSNNSPGPTSPHAAVCCWPQTATAPHLIPPSLPP